MPTLSLQQAFELAVRHHRAGHLAEAEALYRQILTAHPDQPDVLHNLALAARQRGRAADAAAAWQRVASLRPDRLDVLYQLAWALLDANEPYQSARAARMLLEANPGSAEGHATLARASAGMGNAEEAVAAAARAMQLAPDSAEIHDHAGLALQAAGRLADARVAFERAVQLNPHFAAYHRNLAGALDALDDVDASLAAADEAIRLGGEDVQILINLAALHRRRRDYARSLDCAERALRLQPGNPSAHGARAIALLSLGHYGEGLIEYEWRWRCDNFTTRPRDFGRPMWDGSDPAGRTILVHGEQGFGDVIQFVRYVPLLAARGAKVILECHNGLRPLLRRVGGVAKVVPSGVNPPDFDLHTPLLSLPKHFTTSLEQIPSRVPYVTPDPARVDAWRSKLTGAGRKIGLVWRGNVKPDPNRTCPISALAPLVAARDARFYSLQVGPAARDVEVAPERLRVTDLSRDLPDFGETAAAMQCLDLIITIDTAAAHLAGALGRPTWTLLPWAPDWRWLLEREDSPWYPTMRLFRQVTKGDWSEPIGRIVSALAR